MGEEGSVEGGGALPEISRRLGSQSSLQTAAPTRGEWVIEPKQNQLIICIFYKSRLIANQI